MSIFKRSNRKPDTSNETTRPKNSSSPENRYQNEINKSLVGKTVVIKGNVLLEEEARIDGNIQGHLVSKSLVIVGKNGVVNADIQAKEIIIEGTVNGNVNGSYKVEVIPDGVLNGNIVSQRVVLHEGAVFKGNIDMTSKLEKALEKEYKGNN